MRKTAFTEEQVAHALRQVESGTPVAEVYRKLGNSEQTLYRWKRKFGGWEWPSCVDYGSSTTRTASTSSSSPI